MILMLFQNLLWQCLNKEIRKIKIIRQPADDF